MHSKEERFFLKTHEWVRFTGDGTAEVGISDHAQHILGPTERIELPSEGQLVLQGEPFCELECWKCVTELFSPVTGRITAVNGLLSEHPEALNSDPWGTWIFRCECAEERGGLLDEDAYSALISE